MKYVPSKRNILRETVFVGMEALLILSLLGIIFLVNFLLSQRLFASSTE